MSGAKVAARGLINLAQATEAALIVAAQARDQAAFGELVKRRQGWARALLRRMCQSHAEADDLAQEAFIKAWDRLRDLETPAAFPGWFRRIAVTTFLMAKRKQKAVFEEIDDASPIASRTPHRKPQPAQKSTWRRLLPGCPMRRDFV